MSLCLATSASVLILLTLVHVPNCLCLPCPHSLYKSGKTQMVVCRILKGTILIIQTNTGQHISRATAVNCSHHQLVSSASHAVPQRLWFTHGNNQALWTVCLMWFLAKESVIKVANAFCCALLMSPWWVLAGDAVYREWGGQPRWFFLQRVNGPECV